MAGEIEEPFSIGFQAGSIHSGSVSFGRFENEPLCWERKSTFSRNRYLEEIQQYSKPGSVTEKKAILEAHFRRRALMHQSSSEGQSGSDCPSNENDNSVNVSYNKATEHVNEDSQSSQSKNGCESSECHQDSVTLDYRREDVLSSSSDPPVEAVSSTMDLVEYIAGAENNLGTHQSETEVQELQVVDDGTQVENIHVIAKSAVSIDESSITTDSPKSEAAEKAEKVDLKHRGKSSQKMTTARDVNTGKSRSKPQTNSHPIQRRNHSNVSKDPLKTPAIRDKDASHRSKTENQATQPRVPRMHSSQRNHRLQDLQSSKSSINHDKRSEKDLRPSKVINSHSAPKKTEPKASQTASRNINSVSLNREGTGRTAGGLSFKSDERAERRKQAREAAMNQIQAGTQERAKAEIKQLQRSLNFKATPLPSFYHAANGNKTITSTAKPPKAHSGPVGQLDTSTGRLPLHSKAARDTARPPSRSRDRISSHKASRETSRPATGSSESGARPTLLSRSHTPEAAAGTRLNEKKEKQNAMDTMHKHAASKCTETGKSQQFEGKQSIPRPQSSSGQFEVKQNLRRP